MYYLTLLPLPTGYIPYFIAQTAQDISYLCMASYHIIECNVLDTDKVLDVNSMKTVQPYDSILIKKSCTIFPFIKSTNLYLTS